MTARTSAITYICDACLIKARPLRLPRIRASAAIPSFPASRCRRIESRRGYATSKKTETIEDPDDPLTTSASHGVPAEVGLVPLGHRRRLIELSGDDAPKFLQGLITNNVDAAKRNPFYAAFLDARGRVLWDVFIWPTQAKDWACLIEVDAKEVEDVLRHLKRHKLRSKITINDLPEKEVWASWGLEKHILDMLPVAAPPFPDPRAPGFGFRHIAEPAGNSELDGIIAIAGRPVIPTNMRVYDARRYIFGIAEGQGEIERGVALPMDYNIDLSSGIDFHKGCYVGQELTIRTKHTGVVRKRVLPVQLYPSTWASAYVDEAPEHHPTALADVAKHITGTNIRQVDEEGTPKKGTPAGKLLARIDNVGLALCRLEKMTPFRVSAEGGQYTPGASFKILEAQDGTPLEMPVGVRAFVPPGLQEREKALWDKGRQRNVA
jgi:folate-binding protein YgfZ